MEVEQANYRAARKLFEVVFNITSSSFCFCFFFSSNSSDWLN